MSEKCPEGDKWIDIPSPQVSIFQLSVSPSGVVWGVTWEGVAVVRVGVSYYEPTGEEEIYFNLLFETWNNTCACTTLNTRKKIEIEIITMIITQNVLNKRYKINRY